MRVCKHCGYQVVKEKVTFMEHDLSYWTHSDGNITCVGVAYTSNGPINRHEAEPVRI